MSINSSGKLGKGITLLQRVDRLKALKIKSGEKEENFKKIHMRSKMTGEGIHIIIICSS